GQSPITDHLDAITIADRSVRERTEIRGLFAGGTLCSEAQMVMRKAGLKLASNVPIADVARLGVEVGVGVPAPDAHRLIDLGDDEYTQGRPHPMIDPSVRDQVLADALNDPKVGVILLDVVLGYGGHHDPAGHLASFLQAHSADGRLIVASVTGTDDDPQHRSRQVEKLKRVGVKVALSNADAAVMAVNGLSQRP
ncbi:MAG: acyl-CoA synthetase FdrA, partial [Geminicoccaceae bacterium]